MRTLNRAGFTLIELVVSFVILAVMSGVIAAVVAAAVRSAAHGNHLLVAERTRQSLQLLLTEELRDADAADVLSLAPDRIRFARPVGEAVPCAIMSASMLLADSAWTGVRAPEAGRDHAWVLADPATASWIESPIAAVAPDRCPDGSPALRLDLAVAVPAAALARVTEPVELEAYLSAGTTWLGLLGVPSASPVQPFAGPLASGTTRFLLGTGRLDASVQPRDDAAATISIPLRAVP